MNKAIFSFIVAVLIVSPAFALGRPPSMNNYSGNYNRSNPSMNTDGNQLTPPDSSTVNTVRVAKITKGQSKSFLNAAIKKYKNKNYVGAMQDLDEVTLADPGNALAHYYLGMTYVQIGEKDKALIEYDRVIALSPSSTLATNANIGKNNLTENPQLQNLNKLMNQTIQPAKDFYSDEARQKLQEKDINTIIDNVNNKRENNPEVYKRLQNLDPSAKKSSNDKPTEEEVKAAMEVLTKAGVNPYAQNTQTAQTPQINSDMMQMNMLMSAFGNSGNNMYGGGSSSMNNMMPMLMMMQNGQGNNKIDPEILQVMMSDMMMSGMSGLYENHKND